MTGSCQPGTCAVLDTNPSIDDTDAKKIRDPDQQENRPGVAVSATAHMVAAPITQANDEQRSRMKILGYEPARDHGVPYVDFTEPMNVDTRIEQVRRTRALRESELNYYGLCLFGKLNEINAITGKFSLWR